MRLVTKFVAVLAMTFFVADVAHAQWTWTPQAPRFTRLRKLPKENPELQIQYARGLMMKGDVRQAWEETNKFTEFYGDSDMADQNQFLRGEIKMKQGKWVDAAKEFQRLLSTYPQTTLYNDAIKKQYEIGDSLYERGQKKLKQWWNPARKRTLKHAVEVYSMVIENQPFTLAAAEAQYKLGLCHDVRKEYTEAAFEYKRVIEDYKDSEWVDDACYSLALCYYKCSFAPAYDQSPSELAVRAVDDFSERYPADPRVADLKQKRQEMRNKIAQQQVLTAQFHEKRREFDSARIYYELLSTQYKDTASAPSAQKWLAEHPKTETKSRAEITKLREIQ
jgi:outer membrane protein assembly factor BamD